MTTNNANYRKYNDGTLNSSTYHKKDGTSIRSKLKKETKKIIQEEILIDLHRPIFENRNELISGTR